MSTSTKTFSIKTDVFEGPLDLLLDLVEKRKLLINDISLAAVTDEYMAHVADMQERSLPGTAEFVALAATLLLIKSKSLLPVLELTAEEEDNIEDLEERLKLYQIYREAGKAVEAAFGKRLQHGRQFVPSQQPLFTTDTYTALSPLRDAMWQVLQELPQLMKKPTVQVKQVISIEEMIDRLRARIEAQFTTTFRELIGTTEERTVTIVGFLAILESVKQGSILVAQQTRFSDIQIEKHGFSTPDYH